MNFLESLFDNPGKKIKTFAKISFVIKCIGAIITGIILFFVAMCEGYEILALFSLAVLVFVPFVAYMMTIFIYAFGELVDKTNSINNTISDENTGNKTPSNNTYSHSNANKQSKGTTVSQKKSNPVNFTSDVTVDSPKSNDAVVRYCLSCSLTYGLNVFECPTCKKVTCIRKICHKCGAIYHAENNQCPECHLKQ